MASLALTVPKENAVFRYSYRDTGGIFSAEQIMEGGAGDQSSTFTTPEPCDELRLTATFPSAIDLDRTHFAGLSIVQGLTFDLDWGATTSQTLSTRAGLFQNETLRDATSTPATVFTVTISGIAQRQLTFDQFVLGKVNWQPVETFDDDTGHKSPKRYSRQRTKNHSRQRLTDSARLLNPFFWSLTGDEYDDLVHVCDTVSDTGYLLVELDPESLDPQLSFLADCMVDKFRSNGENKQCELQLIEKNST